MALTRRKKIVFALVAMTLSLAGVMLTLLAADLLLHWRAERSAGLNRYGYRGPVIGRKQPGELRVAMLGGSTAFGYGVGWQESIPAYLEAELRKRLGRPVTVVNLGYNNEGAYAFVPNLEDFEYLDYDVIVLYEGYNDLMGDAGPNRFVYRRNSVIFRRTGYLPILPLYLEEKAMTLRHGMDTNAAYEAAGNASAGPTVFRPGLAQRTSAGALAAVAAMARALDGQLAERPAKTPHPREPALGCVDPWIAYCESAAAAIRYGLTHDNAVVVASQPRLIGPVTREKHESQRAALAGMIERTFAGERRVMWADLGNVVDLTQPNVTFDAMHLTPQANAKVAAALVEPVIAAAKTIRAGE